MATARCRKMPPVGAEVVCGSGETVFWKAQVLAVGPDSHMRPCVRLGATWVNEAAGVMTRRGDTFWQDWPHRLLWVEREVPIAGG